MAPLPFLPVCITVRLGIVVGASHELFIMHCMDGRTKTFKRLLLTIFHSYRASKNCCDKVILPRQARDPKKGCLFLHLVFPTRQCADGKHRRDAVRVGKAELAARPGIGHIIHLLNIVACRTPVLVFVVRFPCVFPEPVLVK